MAGKTEFPLYSYDQVIGRQVYRVGIPAVFEWKELHVYDRMFIWKYSNPDSPVVISVKEREYFVTFKDGSSEKLNSIFMDDRWSALDDEVDPEPFPCHGFCSLLTRMITSITRDNK